MKTTINIPSEIVQQVFESCPNATKYWGKSQVESDVISIVSEDGENHKILLPELLKAFGKMAIEVPSMFSRLIEHTDLPSVDCLVQFAAFGKIEYQ